MEVYRTQYGGDKKNKTFVAFYCRRGFEKVDSFIGDERIVDMFTAAVHVIERLFI